VPETPNTSLTRRGFITVTAGVAGLAVGAGCTSEPPGEHTDPLRELFEAADRDAREFAAADASHGDYADALRTLAEIRQVHATWLGRFLEAPPPANGTSTPQSAGVEAVCPPVVEVRQRLGEDAGQAGDVAVSSRGERAEVAAAVAAACTTAVEVVLS